MSNDRTSELELQLDNFDISERKDALKELLEMAKSGKVELAETGTDVNLHIHSFYSYNACGYSPAKIAWLAKKKGLAVAGIVDFDVFDGLNEFLEAAKLIGLKACVSMETRVFVPEFADKEITSPGEPGITYHVGVGHTSVEVPEQVEGFKKKLRRISEKRNRDLVARVNRFLKPAELDYDNDVIPLTPSGNATERHICLAYARKAHSVFSDIDKLALFWQEKLGTNLFELPEGIDLQALIRAKTMKQGGVGYVQPDKGSFPTMAQTNNFILEAGGIPTLTWVGGFSDGEKEIERLLEISISTGTAAIILIPDRNFTPGVKDQKLANLNHIVGIAESRGLPIVVGTEMNRPGLKFVDDFKSEELAPLSHIFFKGAHIVYAHSVLQKQLGLGYVSKWAQNNFLSTADKNDFYEKLGKELDPSKEDLLSVLKGQKKITPDHILEKIK